MPKDKSEAGLANKAGGTLAVPVDANAADTTARMLLISRALADPRRMEVLQRIATCSATTCTDTRETLGMSPATLSHHMKQLEAADLIETVRDGKFVRSHLRRKVWKQYLAYLKTLGEV